VEEANKPKFQKSPAALHKRAVGVIRLLRGHIKGMQPPMTDSIVEQFGKDPFLMLISCLLSLRAKDTATLPASIRLFNEARTPETLLSISIPKIEQLIYSVGFYRRKARILHAVSRDLLERFAGRVPSSTEELLSIKGVGPKTANLVLGAGFGIPAICVDIHVHQISNRLGLVKTKTPEQTEKALKQILPREYWIEYNRLLVMWGQNICVSVSPWCSRCAVYDLCERVGVARRR